MTFRPRRLTDEALIPKKFFDTFWEPCFRDNFLSRGGSLGEDTPTHGDLF